MNKYIFKIIIILLMISSIITGCQLNIDNSDKNNLKDPIITDYSSNEKIIVKIKNSVSMDLIDNLVPGSREKKIADFNGFSYILYKLDGKDETINVINNLEKNTLIINAEINNKCSIDIIPNDSYYADYQYAPEITNCEEAWEITTGDSSVIVAVLDTGINGEHLDFGTGKVISGYDFINNIDIAAGANSDDNSHGTHVAGIIGAQGNNDTGIAGVAWQTSLMPVKVLSDGGYGEYSQIAQGIIYAVDNGADIINMSLSGSYYSQILVDAVYYAVNNNVTVFVAMGNNGLTVMNYPAGCPGVIAVGSTNARDDLSLFSTTGYNISITAPGESIYSLHFLPNYFFNRDCKFMSGTSMATPFAAGAAALLLANDPTLKPAEIKSILELSAYDLGDPGYDYEFGHGRVDVLAALNTEKINNYGTIIVDADYSDVEVIIYNNENNVLVQSSITSDGSTVNGTDGIAVFPFIFPGEYTVSARINNSVNRSKSVTVRKDRVVTVNLN